MKLGDRGRRDGRAGGVRGAVRARHLAWGYPDQPPLTPFLAGLMGRIAPGSLVALRIPAAIAAGLTVLFTGLLSRVAEKHGGVPVGGGEPAQSSTISP